MGAHVLLNLFNKLSVRLVEHFITFSRQVCNIPCEILFYKLEVF